MARLFKFACNYYSSSVFISSIYSHSHFIFQGNFHHWGPLFLHFETYFKTYLSHRNDLLLSDDILGDVSPFPKQAVLQILRVMQIILENCHTKSSFSVIEVMWCLNFFLSNFSEFFSSFGFYTSGFKLSLRVF